MADLSELASSQSVKSAGADSSGLETNYVGANVDGSLNVAGTGTAGVPGTNVLTIQGITSGTPVPISGAITATNPSVGTVGAAVPTSATTVGGVDLSGNLQDILVDTTGVQITTDRNNVSMVYSALTVGTTAVEVKVGGAALANRKLLLIHNASGNTMYWGSNNSVTTSNGMILFRDQVISIPVGPAISIWIISGVAAQNARITEMS